MKELYIAPELKITCFAPVERLAADDELFLDDLIPKAEEKPSAGIQDGDLDLDL